MAVTTGRGRGRSLRVVVYQQRVLPLVPHRGHDRPHSLTHDPNQVGLQRSRQPDCRTRDGQRSHHMPYIVGVLRLARSTRARRYYRLTITTMTSIPR
jgi:hypothetical protein